MTKGQVAQIARGMWRSPAVIKQLVNFYMTRAFDEHDLARHAVSLQSQRDDDKKTLHGLIDDYMEAYPAPQLNADQKQWAITAGAVIRKDAKNHSGLSIPASTISSVLGQRL